MQNEKIFLFIFIGMASVNNLLNIALFRWAVYMFEVKFFDLIFSLVEVCYSAQRALRIALIFLR